MSVSLGQDSEWELGDEEELLEAPPPPPPRCSARMMNFLGATLITLGGGLLLALLIYRIVTLTPENDGNMPPMVTLLVLLETIPGLLLLCSGLVIVFSKKPLAPPHQYRFLYAIALFLWFFGMFTSWAGCEPGGEDHEPCSMIDVKIFLLGILMMAVGFVTGCVTFAKQYNNRFNLT